MRSTSLVAALAAALLVSAFATLAPSPAQAWEVCDQATDPANYPPHDRWAVIADKGLGDWIFAQGELLPPANISRALDTLARLSRALRARGIAPVMVVIPPRLAVAEDKLDLDRPAFSAYRLGSMADSYSRTLAELRKAGWEVPDLAAIAADSGLGPDFFNAMDHHWSTAGTNATAEVIAELLADAKELERVQRTPFSLETRDVENVGTYRYNVLQKCGGKIPAPVTTSYKAVSDREVSAASLLGDGPQPDVVLVGTSQSRRQDFDRLTGSAYFEDSFAALLRHHLSVDLLNMAAEGGGTFTSIESWLTSREFQKNRPRALIWEVNATDGFDQPEHLRQLVPAVHGVCSADDALAMHRGSAENGARLKTSSSLALAGSRHYVAIKLTDKAAVNFAVTFTHAQTRKETVWVKRSPLLPNSGLFFVELNDAITLPLTSIDVATPGAQGTVDARLCAAP